MSSAKSEGNKTHDTYASDPFISDYTSINQELQDDASSMSSLLDISNSNQDSGNISSLPCEVELESMVSVSTTNRHRKKAVDRDIKSSFCNSGAYMRLAENESAQNGKIFSFYIFDSVFYIG